MYIREIQPPAASPVINGMPIQGTWTRSFEKVNLLDIQKPFSIPFPKWVSSLRIKEWQYFIVQNDELFFESIIANLKMFRFIETVFMDKKTNKLKIFYDYFPFALWELPDSLSNNFIECNMMDYSMSIHNWLNSSAITFSFEAKLPASAITLDTAFEISFKSKGSLPLVTSLLFSEERIVYTYKNIGYVSGWLNTEEDARYILSPNKTIGMFVDCKGFFPYITKYETINAFGFTKDGRLIGFSMTENQAKYTNKDNENVFWLDNILTLLPPVKITHAYGLDNDWIIEDVEGMVDLSFTPQKQTEKTGFDILISKSEFFNPIGVFNGMIMTKDGEKIYIRNLCGCAKNLYLRL
jgi:hypothetical protein